MVGHGQGIHMQCIMMAQIGWHSTFLSLSSCRRGRQVEVADELRLGPGRDRISFRGMEEGGTSQYPAEPNLQSVIRREHGRYIWSVSPHGD